MKTRQGFVSNSSSSSFIVAWDKKPKTSEEIKSVLYNNSEYINHIYNDDVFNTLELSEIILNDTNEATSSEIKEELRNSISLYDGKWYQKPYKGDEKLMKLAVEEDIYTSKELDKLKPIMDKYTWEERDKIRKHIERIKKMDRISNIDVPKISKEQKLFFETDKKHDEMQNRHWHNKYIKKLVNNSYKSFIKDNKDKFIALYEFSDNSGSMESFLEHSGTFDNLTHIKISNH